LLLTVYMARLTSNLMFVAGYNVTISAPHMVRDHEFASSFRPYHCTSLPKPTEMIVWMMLIIMMLNMMMMSLGGVSIDRCCGIVINLNVCQV
jgi:hypothetical protein